MPAFLFYNRYVDAFIDVRPNYPALVWIWSGMAFLWGVAFFEISRDPMRAYPLVKYSWLEKIVTSSSILVGWIIGDIPARLLLGVVFTDMIWIPLFIWVHLGLARWRARSGPHPRTRSNVMPPLERRALDFRERMRGHVAFRDLADLTDVNVDHTGWTRLEMRLNMHVPDVPRFWSERRAPGREHRHDHLPRPRRRAAGAGRALQPARQRPRARATST